MLAALPLAPTFLVYVALVATIAATTLVRALSRRAAADDRGRSRHQGRAGS